MPLAPQPSTAPVRGVGRRRLVLTCALVTVTAALGACTSTGGPEPSATRSRPPSPAARTKASSPAARRTPAPSSSTPRSSAGRPTSTSAADTGRGPVIVVDPGHSVTVHATDPATGLDVSDYENEPEMTDVFAVALLVRSRLLRAGYRVVLTKTAVDDPTSLGRRATIANEAHAALAISIHDQAGSSGGIGFDAGNNTVYYQSVDDYRVTPTGRRVSFTDAAVARTSAACGRAFRKQRAATERHAVVLRGDTGYDLGSRGLAAGNIWMVQLLARVPWIYNEAGGNSAGQVGLDSADRARYADGLVAGVEACVPRR